MKEFLCVYCNSHGVLSEDNEIFLGSKNCKCYVCNKSWIHCAVCEKECCNQRNFVFFNKDEIRRHYSRYHTDVHRRNSNMKRMKLSNSIETIDFNEVIENKGSDRKLEIESTSLTTMEKKCFNEVIETLGSDDCMCSDVVNLNDTNCKMKDYFAHKLSKLSNHYLVSLSQFHTEKNMDRISEEDIDVHMNYATLLMKSNRTDRLQLVSTIEKIVNVRLKQVMQDYMGNKGSFEASEEPLRTMIPMTVSSARSLYLKGKYSLMEILPKPQITILADGKHAYISLFEIIQDAFGHGVDMLNLNEPMKCCTSEYSHVTNIRESQRAQEIREASPPDSFSFLFLEWRDDARANRGMRNNGCLWIKTISFVSQNNRESRTNTYPIAIGPKGANHDIVEHKFKEELSQLKSHDKKHFVYSAIEKKNIRVYGDIFSSLMDQPERRSSNCLMLGNGLFSSRWGYSLNLKKLQNVIPSCSSCYQRNLQDVISCRKTNQVWKCDTCLNWNIDSQHKLLVYPSPNSFPEGELNEDKDKQIKPFQLSYELITKNVSKVFHNIKHGKWSARQARAFLSVLCVSHTAQENIIAHAQNAYELLFLEKNQLQYPSRYINILKKKKECPSLFLEWKFPSLWTRKIPLRRTSDVVMHLVFLGIEKHVNKDITKFMLYNEKLSPFRRQVDDLLNNIQSLNIKDWCDILPYDDGNFSNWISDNHLSMSRLSSWFYVSLKTILINYKEPCVPVTSWSKRDCERWLKYRGLKHDDKLIKCLRSRVQWYKSRSNVPPILYKHDIEKQCDLVLALVNSKTCLIYRLMSKHMSPKIIHEISLYTKLFLSLYVKFDILYDPAKKNPSWVTASNFICLLNLPGLIEDVGPLRNLWEGGDIGEKVLGLVKDEFNGFRKQWAKALLNNVYTQSAMEKIKLSMETPINSCDRNKYNRYGRFHKYKTKLEVKLLLIEHKVLSIIEYENSAFFIVLKDGSTMRLLIETSEETKVMCGFTYFCWKILNISSQKKNLIDVNKIVRYCLLLPWLQQDAEDTVKFYTVISDDWKTMSKDKQFVFPNMTNYI